MGVEMQGNKTDLSTPDAIETIESKDGAIERELYSGRRTPEESQMYVEEAVQCETNARGNQM